MLSTPSLLPVIDWGLFLWSSWLRLPRAFGFSCTFLDCFPLEVDSIDLCRAVYWYASCTSVLAAIIARPQANKKAFCFLFTPLPVSDYYCGDLSDEELLEFCTWTHVSA